MLGDSFERSIWPSFPLLVVSKLSVFVVYSRLCSALYGPSPARLGILAGVLLALGLHRTEESGMHAARAKVAGWNPKPSFSRKADSHDT